MGERFLIDTNALLDFQGELLPPKGSDFITSIIDVEFNISIINKIELLGSKYVTPKTESFINLARVFELDTNVVNTTIQLRKNRRIKLPDAIIAATAIVYGLTLVTRNTKDFTGIKDLKVVNPHKL